MSFLGVTVPLALRFAATLRGSLNPPYPPCIAPSRAGLGLSQRHHSAFRPCIQAVVSGPGLYFMQGVLCPTWGYVTTVDI